MVKKIGHLILGFALIFGFWTVQEKMGCGHKNPGRSSHQLTSKKLPEKVWDGGGGSITIEAEVTEPASVVATFETAGEFDDKNHKYLEAWESIAPGKHSFTIEVPPKVGGSVAVLFPDPQVAKIGTKLSIRLFLNGSLVGEDSQLLTQPLADGDGMHVEVQVADFSSGNVKVD